MCEFAGFLQKCLKTFAQDCRSLKNIFSYLFADSTLFRLDS